MAYPHTPSRARGEVADSDIEPSDIAPSAAPSPLSISVRPNVEAVEGPESVSAESAGPVSAPTLSLSLSGKPSLFGQSRYTRVCGSFSSGGLRPAVPQRSSRPA